MRLCAVWRLSLWLLWWCCCAALPVRAQEAARLTDLQLERTSQGVYLSATMQWQLPRLVEDALLKGIAMHFVAEAQLVRQRWYWWDKVQQRQARYLRLSYQPLTRRWRLAQSSAPLGSSGSEGWLGQNYEELDEALAAMQRITRWKIVEADALEEGADYSVQFQFRLDTSQLPRLLQFGAVGSAHWNLQLRRSLPVPAWVPAQPHPAAPGEVDE